MTWSTLFQTVSPRDRRTLLLGVAVVGTLIMTSRGLPAWRRWVGRERAAASDWHAQADRALRMARVLHPMRDSLTRRVARWDTWRIALVDGATAAAATANLATLISTTATSANVRLGAIDVQVDSARTAGRSALTRVSVHTEITGDVAGLMEFLSDLESGPTLVTVSTLAVTPTDWQAPADRAEQLRVELTLGAQADLSPAMSDRPHGPSSDGSVIPNVAALPVVLFVSDTILDSIAEAVVDHDPFRLDRQAATVSYDAATNGVPVPPPPPSSAPAKPSILLAGIVGGPPWTAVLVVADGSNVLARTSDTVWRSPLAVIRGVTRDSAVVRWSDTTWRLGLRRSWQ